MPLQHPGMSRHENTHTFTDNPPEHTQSSVLEGLTLGNATIRHLITWLKAQFKVLHSCSLKPVWLCIFCGTQKKNIMLHVFHIIQMNGDWSLQTSKKMKKHHKMTKAFTGMMIWFRHYCNCHNVQRKANALLNFCHCTRVIFCWVVSLLN